MRHAFLITAYTDFDFLKKAIEVYASDSRVDCYIHVDKKSKVPKDFKIYIQDACFQGGYSSIRNTELIGEATSI